MGAMSLLQVRENLLRIGVGRLDVFCHSKKKKVNLILSCERERDF